MTNTVTLKNATVSFSTMLNRPEKAKFGRCFKVLIPIDSPELEQLKSIYNELNKKATKAFSEKLGEKIRQAIGADEVFSESLYKDGFVELKFEYAKMKEVEVEIDGEKVKQYEEKVVPMYQKTPLVCTYKGATETEGGKKFFPMSSNEIDITMSLQARYSEKDKRPIIFLKAEEVEIVKSDFGDKSKKSLGYISLDEDNQTIEKRVEKKSVSQTKETFTEDELSELDLANI
jgi:hypothetical protein